MTWLTRILGSEADKYSLRAFSLAKSTLRAGIAADNARIAMAQIAADGRALKAQDLQDRATWGETVYSPEYIWAKKEVDRLETKRTKLAHEAIAVHYIAAALARKEEAVKPASLDELAGVVEVVDETFSTPTTELMLFYGSLLGGGLAAGYYFDVCQESKRMTCDQDLKGLLLWSCIGLLVWLLLLKQSLASRKSKKLVMEALVKDYLHLCASVKIRPESLISDFEERIALARTRKYGSADFDDVGPAKNLVLAIRATITKANASFE